MQFDEQQTTFGEKSLDSPADSAEPRRVFSALIGAFLFVLLLVILLSRRWVLQALDEFDVGLPAVSAVALSPALPLTVGILLSLMIAKQFLIKSPRVATAGNAIALLVGLLLLVVYLVGVVSPFLLLMDSLS